MKSKVWTVLTAGSALLISTASLFAHHSASLYDRDHPVTVIGNVTEYRFLNPHVQIYFEVVGEDGTAEKWLAESGPPQRLFRAGWNAKSLKVGDKISVKGFPVKDGRKILSIVNLTGEHLPALTEGAD
jgi:hypothetical protein